MQEKLRMRSPLLYELVQYGQTKANQTALCWGDRRGSVQRLTYAQVLVNVSALRLSYLRLAACRIGLLAENSAELACSLWAVIAAGKQAILLDPSLADEELLDALKKADVEYLVRDASMADLDSLVESALPGLKCASLPALDVDAAAPDDALNWTEGDVIVFTSGTSKHSKVVETPAWAFCGDVSAQSHLIRHEEGELVYLPLPLHHSFGFAALNIFYKCGCPVYIGSMQTLLADAKTIPCKIMVLVPSAMDYLSKKNAFPKSLTSILVSGGYCSVELANRVRQHGILVQNRYGSSEIPCGIAESLPGDEVDALTLHTGMQVEIADDQEVVITSPYTMRGYYQNPEETADVLRNGKVYTGDAGMLDEHGKLHLFGRKKNIILMANGEKLHSDDIDTALQALPGVEDAAVIYMDQKLIAVIRPMAGVTEEQIRAEIAIYNTALPYQRRMQQVWIHPEPFPYTSSGKMQRRKLEDAWLARKNK